MFLKWKQRLGEDFIIYGSYPKVKFPQDVDVVKRKLENGPEPAKTSEAVHESS